MYKVKTKTAEVKDSNPFQTPEVTPAASSSIAEEDSASKDEAQCQSMTLRGRLSHSQPVSWLAIRASRAAR